MKTHTVTTYLFDELSPEAKQKAIDNLLYINVDYDWWEFVYDDAREIHCKIDGFSINREGDCDLKLTKDAETVADLIMKNHGEICDTYKLAAQYKIDLARLDEKPGEDQGDEHNDLEEEFTKQLSECYLSMLRQEYEYLTSEEAIKETIQANEYEFTIDGKLY